MAASPVQFGEERFVPVVGVGLSRDVDGGHLASMEIHTVHTVHTIHTKGGTCVLVLRYSVHSWACTSTS